MTPRDLTDQRHQIAQEYAADCERMGHLESLYAGEWLELRKAAKTDREADKMWDASELGREMSVLKWKLKGMDKLLSAIAAKIRVLEGEGRAQF